MTSLAGDRRQALAPREMAACRHGAGAWGARASAGHSPRGMVGSVGRYASLAVPIVFAVVTPGNAGRYDLTRVLPHLAHGLIAAGGAAAFVLAAMRLWTI